MGLKNLDAVEFKNISQTINLFWFRRDLRLNDNMGLFNALKSRIRVQPIFIFDINILDDIDNKNDRRVSFIYETIQSLKLELQKLNSDLWVFKGDSYKIFQELTVIFRVESIYLNRDYEPYAKERDEKIEELCKIKKIEFKCFKDQVVFEKLEVSKADNLPYTVFTPYMKRWKLNYESQPVLPIDVQPDFKKLHTIVTPQEIIEIKDLGFSRVPHLVSDLKIPLNVIANYDKNRDLLEIEGTSRLSVHLRFGTLSIRKLVKIAIETNEKFLNELIWREFYMQILDNFPHVVTHNFKPQYDAIQWNASSDDFDRWASGKTGYPIIDAAICQLLETGFMHNRARMIVASFLTKHLLIDWRKGEAFFAKHLTDYELSSNNGGWQWAASTGCDAVPYFRIFNPYTQAKRYDPKGVYVKKWLKDKVAIPMIEHSYARERCLNNYKKALSMHRK